MRSDCYILGLTKTTGLSDGRGAIPAYFADIASLHTIHMAGKNGTVRCGMIVGSDKHIVRDGRKSLWR